MLSFVPVLRNVQLGCRQQWFTASRHALVLCVTIQVTVVMKRHDRNPSLSSSVAFLLVEYCELYVWSDHCLMAAKFILLVNNEI